MKQLSKSEIEELRKHVEDWKKNPLRFVKNILNVKQTWKLQDNLLASLPVAIEQKKQIYVASGHSLGKDFICGTIGPWFLHCYRPSIVVLTAPTDRQVKSIMWKETLGHWNNRTVDLGGRAYTEPRIEIAKDWFLTGFATKETGATKDSGGGKFQGIHSPSVCIIVTEAQAVEDTIYDQIDAISTAANILTIFIGNPTRAKGRFAAGLRDREKNIVFNFSCLENPNYLERKVVIPGLATYEWVEDKRVKWGENDPRWKGRVLGQIPENALNINFTAQLLELMHKRNGLNRQFSSCRGVAVDAAGEGVDDNVFLSGDSGDIVERYKRTSLSPTEVALKAVEMCKAIGGWFIVVDCDGVGARDYKELTSLPEDFLDGIQIIKFHGSAPSNKSIDIMSAGKLIKKKMYANLRAEASFVTADRAKAGRATLPEDMPEIEEDLQADEWFENSNGLIQLIDKDEIRESLERSPGDGDAYKMLQWAFEQDIKDERKSKRRKDGYADREEYTLNPATV